MSEKIIITALIVFAVWATMWEGGIFGIVRTWFANLREDLQKPLFSCAICMTPWYGSVVYWVIWGSSVKEWAIVVVAAMGLNAVIVKLSCD
jgi:hypothetical protein